MRRSSPSKTVNSRAGDSVWDASRLRLHASKTGTRPEALAVAAGVSAATVVRWMTGRTCPSLVEARLMADALGVSVSDLLPPHGATASGAGGSARRGKR